MAVRIEAGARSVIWINGAFGVGKTSVARAVIASQMELRFYDPELLGIVMHRLVPRSLRPDDFQSWRLWQWLTAMVLLISAWVGRSPVVVPMTLVDAGPRRRIIGTLRRLGVDVREVWLAADADTIARRLRDRGDPVGSWAEQQLDRCLAFSRATSELPHVDASRPIEDVRDSVLELMGARP